MKITKSLVKQFENDQKENGTKTALFNIIWMLAAEILNDLGIKSIKTR